RLFLVDCVERNLALLILDRDGEVGVVEADMAHAPIQGNLALHTAAHQALQGDGKPGIGGGGGLGPADFRTGGGDRAPARLDHHQRDRGEDRDAGDRRDERIARLSGPARGQGIVPLVRNGSSVRSLARNSSVTARPSSRVRSTCAFRITSSSVRCCVFVLLPNRRPPTTGKRERNGRPFLPKDLEFLNRPPRAITCPSCTAIEVEMRRVEMVGESMLDVWFGETSLTSCAMSRRTSPLLLTRGVTFRITPVSRYSTEFTTA